MKGTKWYVRKWKKINSERKENGKCYEGIEIDWSTQCTQTHAMYKIEKEREEMNEIKSER